MQKVKYSIILLFSIYYLLFSNSAQAAIGPEPSSDAPKDYTAPSMISNVALTSDGVKVIITWTDPTESDFYRVEILRNDGTGTMVTGYVRATVGKGIGRYEDTDVLAGQSYLYRFRVSDFSINTRLSDEYSVTVVAPAPEVVSQPAADTEPQTETQTPISDDAGQQTILTAQEILDPTDRDALLNTFNLSYNAAAEQQYRGYIVKDMAEFEIQSTATIENAIVNFVVYGASPATLKLGAGERRALIRDYFETVGRGTVAWGDIEKMATGVKPVGRNLDRERAQLPLVLNAWVKMRGRNPNFQDAAEDLAWNTMMYRVRFTRDLTKETQGIAEFRGIFKRTPTSPLDWAAVRALGYVL